MILRYLLNCALDIDHILHRLRNKTNHHHDLEREEEKSLVDN